MALFYFEFPCGCGLHEAPNIAKAERSLRLEIGTANGPVRVSPATDANIQWVAGMGGWVPDKYRKRLKKPRSTNATADRNADRIDGYDRDDLGESPDY